MDVALGKSRIEKPVYIGLLSTTAHFRPTGDSILVDVYSLYVGSSHSCSLQGFAPWFRRKYCGSCMQPDHDLLFSVSELNSLKGLKALISRHKA